MIDTLTQEEIALLNELNGFMSFRPNFILQRLMEIDADIIMIPTGNRGGKTSTIVKNYVMSMMGVHPVERFNIRPSTPVRTIRFASENLPMETDGAGETRNTIYPELKKWLPPFMIKKDITLRKPNMTIQDIYQGGKDMYVEFVSYNQQVQSQAGVDRWSCFLDEESPYDFFQEQIPRLLTAKQSGSGGHIIIGCTPVQSLTWLFNDVFERANVRYNSPTIRAYLEKKYSTKVDEVEILRA